MTAAKVRTGIAGSIQQIPLGDLRPASWNARRTFDAAAIAELAESIRVHGLQNPLIVRILPISSWKALTDAEALSKSSTNLYEIVAGHRRLAALTEVGDPFAPCIIREFTDDQAREIGLVENLQRENLPPMEEAEGLGELMKRPGATIETVAAQIGKGKTYVGQRLQLLKAIVPVSEALKAGAIELAHAFVLARLTPIQQARFLDELNCGYNAPRKNGSIVEAALAKSAEKTKWSSTPDTAGTLKAEIERSELRVLADAPFALDATLAPMPCTDCPKRSVNAGLLFADLATDTCTDRSCFDRKVQAFIAGELELARKEKRVLLRYSGSYSSEKGVICGYDVTRVESNACGHADQAIYINGVEAGKKLLICRRGACKTHGRGAVASSPGSAGYAADPSRKKKLAKVNAEKKFRRALFAAIAKEKLPATVAWFPALIRLAAYAITRSNSQYFGAVVDALGWDRSTIAHDDGKKLREKLAVLPHPDVIRAALLASESSELFVQDWDIGKADGLLALAKLFGVDAAKVRKQVEELAPKKDAAPAKAAGKPAAPEKKGQRSARPVLSAAARKRVAEAQRKRWAQLRKSSAKGGRK